MAWKSSMRWGRSYLHAIPGGTLNGSTMILRDPGKTFVANGLTRSILPQMGCEANLARMVEIMIESCKVSEIYALDDSLLHDTYLKCHII
eukprot:scaffold6013_cov118-Skeletonema_dohrnii-CCMP3373.AAC.2